MFSGASTDSPLWDINVAHPGSAADDAKIELAANAAQAATVFKVFRFMDSTFTFRMV